MPDKAGHDGGWETHLPVQTVTPDAAKRRSGAHSLPKTRADRSEPEGTKNTFILMLRKAQRPVSKHGRSGAMFVAHPSRRRTAAPQDEVRCLKNARFVSNVKDPSAVASGSASGPRLRAPLGRGDTVRRGIALPALSRKKIQTPTSGGRHRRGLPGRRRRPVEAGPAAAGRAEHCAGG